VPGENSVLVVSMVGFVTKEIKVGNQNVIDIMLDDDIASLDQVIVTGVMDKRTRMESSVAISVLNSKQIEQQAPTSAADLLKNIPGVYVNAAAGEIKNEVSSRGFSGVNGYYYVSMQEDGLPVTGAQYTNYNPDFFLRPDLTLGKLEAVRGGTASILGNNAPGGIFNYVSKTGGPEFTAEVRAKYGLEGNKAANPYYRMDANVGGAIGKSNTFYYNVGGFLRQNDGPRYAGYPLNNGGQIKGNVVKHTKNGSIKLYVKYLNDKNSFLDFLPSVDYNDPKLAPGVNVNTSFLLPPVRSSVYVNDTKKLLTYDSRDKIHNKEISVGLNTDFDLGKGWSIDNKIRFSDKTSYWNSTQVPFPIAVDGVTFYGLNGWVPKFGNYSFSDLATGQELLVINQGLNIVNGVPAGIKFTTVKGSLPGESIQKNSLVFNPLVIFDNRVKEVVEQFTLNKKIGKMNFTGGIYYVASSIDRTSSGAGTAFVQMQDTYPRTTAITYTNPANGLVEKLTNPDGVVGGGLKNTAASLFDVTYNQKAAFFGHNWEITPRLYFDWGIRFESIRVKGTNQIGTLVSRTDGGNDGDPLTLYDNTTGAITSKYEYDKTVKTTSFSSGLNYKINDNLAFYGRYSLGKKAPDVSIYLSINTSATSNFLNPIAQSTQMFEWGAKIRKNKLSLFVTPFYSILGNLPQQAYGQETGEISSAYSTAVIYNKIRTLGLELEGNYAITKNVGLRGVATFQKSKAVDYSVWSLGANGKADDKTVSYSGNENENIARTLLRLSPYWNSTTFFASIDFTYMGKRQANIANAFYLPGFLQSNLNLGYNINKHLTLQGNVNNVFNKYGVMGWAGPGGFPAALNTQGVTKESIAANPNAIFSTTALQPRAFFLTVGYKF
jgi:iron complex outermembrane receptor protein